MNMYAAANPESTTTWEDIIQAMKKDFIRFYDFQFLLTKTKQGQCMQDYDLLSC